VRRQGDLDAIAARVEALCAGLGQKVDMIAWYDGFSLDPALEAAYADMVARMEKAYYRSSTRFTRNPFTRARFGAELAKRDLTMQLRRDAILTQGAMTERRAGTAPRLRPQHRPARVPQHRLP
jgi:propionate CoA-transferase